MRFAQPKTTERQARAVLFRSRERPVHQRTELANALRAVLYEYGYTFAKGLGRISRIEAIHDESDNGLPELVREECRDLLAQIAEQTVRIDAKTKKI